MGMNPNNFLKHIKNLKNIKRTSSYHDKSLRKKADWVERNNNYNVGHMMGNDDEGRATRKQIKDTYEYDKNKK